MTPATVRRYMAYVYLGSILLWLALGYEKALPWWLVALAVVFCVMRAWMALRKR